MKFRDNVRGMIFMSKIKSVQIRTIVGTGGMSGTGVVVGVSTIVAYLSIFVGFLAATLVYDYITGEVLLDNPDNSGATNLGDNSESKLG